MEVAAHKSEGIYIKMIDFYKKIDSPSLIC